MLTVYGILSVRYAPEVWADTQGVLAAGAQVLLPLHRGHGTIPPLVKLDCVADVGAQNTQATSEVLVNSECSQNLDVWIGTRGERAGMAG